MSLHFINLMQFSFMVVSIYWSINLFYKVLKALVYIRSLESYYQGNILLCRWKWWGQALNPWVVSPQIWNNHIYHTLQWRKFGGFGSPFSIKNNKKHGR